MTEYTVLIIGDADRWWSMTEEQSRETHARHGEFAAALAKGGHEIRAGAQLQQSSRAHSVPPGGGTATEGPYAEVTEQVGGFYVVATDDLEGLLECCQIIAADGDGIEVRPNVEMGAA
jgi:hypothetical protein